MAASDADGLGTVVKVVAVKPDNAGRGLPTIRASALWLDGDTGEAQAIIDGSALTALRTGAASGAATALLADRSASVLAVLGAGAQAPDQVRAIRCVRAIRSVRIASRTAASACRLAENLSQGDSSLTVTTHPTPEDALQGADVVCCATPSQVALFPAAALGHRVHINAVGAFRPDMCELGADTFRQASLVAVDQVAAARSEAGDVIHAARAGALRLESLVELGQLLSGQVAYAPEGTTIFKSVGLAAQDWAVAHLAVTRAVARDREASLILGR
jgi:ornithine cyclodeaminase